MNSLFTVRAAAVARTVSHLYERWRPQAWTGLACIFYSGQAQNCLYSDSDLGRLSFATFVNGYVERQLDKTAEVLSNDKNVGKYR